MASSRLVTLRDVAEAAQVSTATASNALTGRRPVHPDTVARVLQEAERLGYRVNRDARALRTSRTDTIALCLSNHGEGGMDVPNEYYMQLVRAATDTAFSQGQRLLLAPEVRSVAEAAALGVDGAIVMDPRPREPQLDFFATLELPVVTIERDPGRPEHVWVVRSDNDALIHTVFDHLVAQGAERPAFLVRQSRERSLPWEDETAAAYRAWATARGIEPRIIAVEGRIAFSPELTAAVHALLASADRPDGVVTAYEYDGISVMRAAREAGIDVPRELKVATALDGALARSAHPSLTAMDIDPAAQGAAAAALLLERIDGSALEPPAALEPRLQARESTA